MGQEDQEFIKLSFWKHSLDLISKYLIQSSVSRFLESLLETCSHSVIKRLASLKL